MIKEKILLQSAAVRTPLDQSVRSIIEKVSTRFDQTTEYKTSIIQWLKPIIDLSEFYVYPTNGITEGLNWWMSTDHRSIKMKVGDYQWVSPRNGPDQIFYTSVPSAIDGNFKDIPLDIPVALDLAYVGSTLPKKIHIGNNVEYVFYSFSKPFGVRNIRTGWLFTRNIDKKLDALIYNAKYYNYYALDVAEKIIKNFDINYIYNKYHNKQFQLCKELNIVPSDSVWLATSNNTDYKKFKRSSTSLARICLAEFYNE